MVTTLIRKRGDDEPEVNLCVDCRFREDREECANENYWDHIPVCTCYKYEHGYKTKW